MKKNWLKLVALLLSAFVTMTFVSCDDDTDDDNGGNEVLVEDGLYVKGAGTALVDLDPKGMMKTTRNEVVQEDRTELKEIYIAVEAGGSFNIVEVAGAENKMYGPGDDFISIADADLDNDEPRPGLSKGSIIESETAFTVTEAGLYHVTFDTELGKGSVAKADWGIIGAATPGGWSGSTQLTASTFDKESITFSLENVEMKANEYKFRYSNGWKIILDAEYDLGDGDAGIKVNTNLGGALDVLVPGGDNIANTVAGLYTMTVTWTLADGLSASAEKTGDLAITDWTNIDYDVFGTGVSGDNANAVDDPSSWGWGKSLRFAAPEIEGEVANGAIFTYKLEGLTLSPADAEGFAFRTHDDGEYNGTVHRFAVVDTAASSDKVVSTTNGYGDVNANVTVEGQYDIILEVDASDNDKTVVTIVEAGAATYDMWGIIGSATPSGWDADTDLTPNEDGTEWTWTGDLVAGEYKFRANDLWDSQIGDNGSGGAEFSNNATAWVIAEGEAGNYTITLDSETPAVTITKN